MPVQATDIALPQLVPPLLVLVPRRYRLRAGAAVSSIVFLVAIAVLGPGARRLDSASLAAPSTFPSVEASVLQFSVSHRQLQTNKTHKQYAV